MNNMTTAIENCPPSAHESFLFTSIAAAILRVNKFH